MSYNGGKKVWSINKYIGFIYLRSVVNLEGKLKLL